MAKTVKPTQSEIDGIQYRRAKLWQIILYSCNALVSMSVYSLIGYANYAGMIGFGLTAAFIGIVLTCARIFDGITDPLLAFLYDKVDTKFGKLRILMAGGFAIEAVALLLMFDMMSSKGFGAAAFILLYALYVIGYTITNMTGQTLPAIHVQRSQTASAGGRVDNRVQLCGSHGAEHCPLHGHPAPGRRRIQSGLPLHGREGLFGDGRRGHRAGVHRHLSL